MPAFADEKTNPETQYVCSPGLESFWRSLEWNLEKKAAHLWLLLYVRHMCDVRDFRLQAVEALVELLWVDPQTRQEMGSGERITENRHGSRPCTAKDIQRCAG